MCSKVVRYINSDEEPEMLPEELKECDGHHVLFNFAPQDSKNIQVVHKVMEGPKILIICKTDKKYNLMVNAINENIPIIVVRDKNIENIKDILIKIKI